MQPAVPRYTQIPFPKYRYVPKTLPHPEIHPEGHSYGKKTSPESFIPPEKWPQNETYLFGVDLFNHGYWWEAHEAWEKVWMTTPKLDSHGQFLQGLIQWSAAVLKLYSGNQKGFEKLLEEGKKRLEFCLKQIPAPQKHFMGLKLSEWMGGMENFAQTIRSPEGKLQDPLSYTNFPVILLETT
jgi:uncharacterized protein